MIVDDPEKNECIPYERSSTQSSCMEEAVFSCAEATLANRWKHIDPLLTVRTKWMKKCAIASEKIIFWPAADKQAIANGYIPGGGTPSAFVM